MPTHAEWTAATNALKDVKNIKDALARLKELNDGENDDLTAILQPSIDILENMVIYLS